MKVDLWIPARTPPERRVGLETVARVHDYQLTGRSSERLGPADMLVVDHDQRAAVEVIPRLEGLRVVQTLSAGVDAIVDLIPAGITLCDASGVHDFAVAEWVVLAILASNRRLPDYVHGQRAQTWQRNDAAARGSDIEGATALILGYGSIGQAVEQRLAPFGADVVRVARHEREGVHPLTDLPGLLPGADIVVILLPLTPQTRGLVGVEILALMKPAALLVNASRGAVVDTAALVAAVAAGRIRAALDVTDPEPLPDGHPLWTMPGVLITPHIAGNVRREEDRAWRLVADQAARLARGEPLRNVVVDGY